MSDWWRSRGAFVALPPDHVLSAVARPEASWDVLAFVGSLNVGGCERHLATVYPRLAALGLKVGIVTFRRGGPLENDVRAGGVELLCLERVVPHTTIFGVDVSRLDAHVEQIIVVRDIVRLLRSRRVAIAHFFLPGAYIFGGLGALLAGHSNTVMSRRSLNDYQKGHPRAASIERFLHSKMRVLVANAKPVRDQLIAEGAPPEHTLLLHSGVDLERFGRIPDRAVARQQFDLKPDVLVIAIVANLIPYKGHSDLIDALGRIASEIDQRWMLLVAGRDDGTGLALKKQAQSLGIAANIRWLGLIDDVPVLWRAADIGVLASHQEGLPNSLLEAMALGVPMVATKVGGVTDIATDEEDALLVSPRAPQALATALLRLTNSPELRLRLGRAAKARVHNTFSLQACVDSYRHLYELMLRQPRLSGADITRQFQRTAFTSSQNVVPAS
jgi:glycosyltransferase involved in cell wall biosynthesis